MDINNTKVMGVRDILVVVIAIIADIQKPKLTQTQAIMAKIPQA
jgi:hypothetical protein